MPTPERATGAHPGWERSAGAAERAAPGRLARALRLARVGVGFAYFGVGAWGVGTLLLPLVALPARLGGLSEDAVTRRTQRAVQIFYRSFIALICRVLRVGEVQWVNAEALSRGPALIVANHPSLIDTPLLGAKLPQADFVVSSDWLHNRWMRRAIVALGYVNAETGPAVIATAVERLRAGRTLVMYPEGSRSPADGLRPFQRGAAHVALEAGCDILPITIHVTPRVLMKGQPWAAYPSDNPVWRVEVGEPIRTPAGASGEGRALAARRLTALLEEHFQKRCMRGRS